MSALPPPRLAPADAQRLHQQEGGRNGRRLLLFLVLYGLGAGAAVQAAASGAGLACWLVKPCGWLLAGASLHGISLFTHEAVHGTLCRNRTGNALAGALCALPVWQNYAAYRVLHLRHHGDLGGATDPDHYANYSRWSWAVFTLNWLRLLVGYPVYLIAIPWLGWQQGTWRDRAGTAAGVLAAGAASLAGWQLLPWEVILHAWVMPMLAINFMVNLRGMSQHTLLEAARDEVQGTRSILTGRVVRFFMCNENYHLEHHLYPGIPWYGLPQAHALLEPELRRRGAPFIASYAAFLREFIRFSWRCGPWARRA